MKDIAYQLLKFWIKSGLYLYYGKIKISGLENVPKNEPVLFLPNHQGALMDVLLIVTNCHRKPFFLTRSDVFKREELKKFFTFLRMLPIYRIRDGRESLKKNQAVFERCALLFKDKHALVMFPEANHNLRRRVRPLSKGFTRILFNALEKMPEMEIHITPVGMNYRGNTAFPDKVAVHYGRPVSARGMYLTRGNQSDIAFLKEAVSNSLKTLTTHIPEVADYDTTIQKLDALAVDYLNPIEANAAIISGNLYNSKKKRSKSPKIFQAVFRWIFTALNFPIIAIWRAYVKPKVWEPEFTATLRFGFALLAYPVYYVMLFAVTTAMLNGFVGLVVIVGLFLFNWAYVRLN